MVMKSKGIVGRGLFKEHGGLFNRLLEVMDWAIIGLTGWWAHWYHLGSSTLPDSYKLALLISLLASALVFARLGVYRAWRGVSLPEEIRLLGLAWIMVGIGMMTLAFATKEGETFSRIWFVLWVVSAGLTMMLLRFLLRNLLKRLRRRGYNIRSIIIAGTGELGREVAARITTAPWTGLRIAGFFGDHGGPRGECLQGVPLLGQIEDLPGYLYGHPVDQVWLAMPLSEEERIRALLKNLGNTMVDIRLVADPFGQRLLQYSVTEVAGLPVMNLSVSPMQGMDRVIKALEDRILAFLILVLISPLLLAIAIGIKLDSSGPVLFLQKRHGWNGQPIEVWKFRTMYVHAEPSTYRQATRDDPRITRLGGFLRRASLDELPQFFNALQGRMSIVGPRPHPIQMGAIYEDQVYGYMRRHKIKPGITGWAQINGFRGETDTLEKMRLRVEYDLYYIENWSLRFDLWIILMTVLNGFRHQNAY